MNDEEEREADIEEIIKKLRKEEGKVTKLFAYDWKNGYFCPYLPSRETLRDRSLYQVANYWNSKGKGEYTELHDLGCGDAQVLIYALLHYPFTKAVGVELDANYVTMANEAIQNQPKHIADRITIIEGKIQNHALPLTTRCLIYCYLTPNSFAGEMKGRIVECLRRNNDAILLTMIWEFFTENERNEHEYDDIICYSYAHPALGCYYLYSTDPSFSQIESFSPPQL